MTTFWRNWKIDSTSSIKPNEKITYYLQCALSSATCIYYYQYRFIHTVLFSDQLYNIVKLDTFGCQAIYSFGWIYFEWQLLFCGFKLLYKLKPAHQVTAQLFPFGLYIFTSKNIYISLKKLSMIIACCYYTYIYNTITCSPDTSIAATLTDYTYQILILQEKGQTLLCLLFRQVTFTLGQEMLIRVVLD